MPALKVTYANHHIEGAHGAQLADGPEWSIAMVVVSE